MKRGFNPDWESLEQGDQVAFNMAIATLYSIRNELNKANTYSELEMFPEWKSVLDVVHREISPFLNDKEKKDIQELKKNVNEILDKYRRVLEHGQKSMIPSVRNRKLIDQFYSVLYAYDVYLRKAMDRAGLYMAKTSDPRYAVSRK